MSEYDMNISNFLYRHSILFVWLLQRTFPTGDIRWEILVWQRLIQKVMLRIWETRNLQIF